MAFLPVIMIIATLGALKLKPVPSYLVTFSFTALSALYAYRMTLGEVLSASLEGVITAILPVCLLMYASLFLFSLTLGEDSQRLLRDLFMGDRGETETALLLALGLGSVLEGLVGFGISLMVPVSLMVAAGLDRGGSARAGLVAISIPTNFGSMGIMITVLSEATGLAPLALSQAIARISIPHTLLLPFMVLSAYKGTFRLEKAELALSLKSGLLYSAVYTLSGLFLGQQAPSLLSGLALCALMLIRHRSLPPLRIAKPFLPIAAAFLFLLLPLAIPELGRVLDRIRLSFTVYTGKDPARVSLPLVNTPGTLILLGTLSGARILRIRTGGKARETILSQWKTFAVVILIFMVSRLMAYSGMTDEIARTVVSLSGHWYPAFAPMVGMLGSFLTGTSTSACILFGPLQIKAAESLGVNGLVLSSFNGLGAGCGKIPAPQNLVQAMSVSGADTKDLSAIYPVFIVYAVMSAVSCYLLAQ